MEVVSYSQNTFFLFISEWFCHFMRIVILSSDWPVEVTCIMVDYKISFFFFLYQGERLVAKYSDA